MKSRAITMHELIILSYHKILENDGVLSNTEDDFYTVSSNKFERHLQIIEQNNIPIQAPSSLENKTQKKSVLLTFDDGHVSQFHVAQEMLNKRNISGLFFPITSEVGNDGKMSWHQLETLVQNGHQVGSHSHTHPNFNKLLKETIIEEFDHSRSILEQKTEKNVTLFAFPFGGYSEDSLETLKELGVEKCFSTAGIPNKNLDDFLLHRININNSISDLDFERLIKGEKAYFNKRNRELKYQSALRKILGKKAEKRIKEFVKRADS